MEHYKLFDRYKQSLNIGDYIAIIDIPPGGSKRIEIHKIIKLYKNRILCRPWFDDNDRWVTRREPNLVLKLNDVSFLVDIEKPTY